MMRALAVGLLVAASACAREPIQVETQAPVGDYGAGELRSAIDKFVTAGRTPEAFNQLSAKVLELRPAMDRTVAEQSELKLITLGLEPVQSVGNKPIAEQVDALALTVWPMLLAPSIEADAVLVQRDPKAAELMPRAKETASQYLQRLCGGVLAADCKQVVPEHQGAIVGALAVRRATERARNAVAGCLMCGTEPGWHEAVRGWEAQDRMMSSTVHEAERIGDPANWPTAGNASEIMPSLPSAQLDSIGAVVIGGQRYAGPERINAFRDLRGTADAIALHLPPEISLAQVKGLIVDAKASGASKIAVVARLPVYPWEPRVYWLSESGTTRAGLRLTDSLQLLLPTVDHVAGPGAVARVD